MLDQAQCAALVACAARARDCAYAPYSGYKVGAAVVTTDDRVYFGSNVENASYGLSLCAERAALASAVANGSVRARAMVVLTNSSPPATPCGACRQWLAELGEPDCEIICANLAGEIRRFIVAQLLPESFTLKGGNHE